MMKCVVFLFVIIGLGLAAPQPGKLFHEHFLDFLTIIEKETGHEMQHLVEDYLHYDEFKAALDYMQTESFEDLVYEMVHLPEFQALLDFMEDYDIDIQYFLDLFDGLFDNVERKYRHATSGKDFTSFVEDSIALFPKDKLSTLFDQKIAEDEKFATAIENLKSPAWGEVFNALWENEVFKKKVDILAENGIDINVLLREICAIFGQ